MYRDRRAVVHGFARLRGAAKADKVEIRWPDGKIDVLTDVAGNQTIVVEYGGRLISNTAYHPMPPGLQRIR
jgi:enediyne biosynthesis protein E4